MIIEEKPDLPISEAIVFLRTYISKINTVSEWAYALNYSRPYFQLLIKKEFGITPYKIIKEEKLKKVQRLIKVNPECKGIVIAKDAGFNNMQSLCSFLGRNFDTCLTNLRD